MYYNHNSDSHFITFTILIIVFFISFYVIYEIRIILKKRRIDEILDDLASNNAEITPEEFIALRNEKLHGYKYEGYYALTKNFAGIYILHNITKDKYYVGQSKSVLNRVNLHDLAVVNTKELVQSCNHSFLHCNGIPFSLPTCSNRQ